MKRDRNTITVHHAARQTIEANSRQHLPTECGGILLGYREDHHVVVTHALNISTATGTATRYTRDDVEANQQLRAFLESRESGDPIGYVGEWHSHPVGSGPSSIDIRAIRATAQNLAAPLALLVCTPGDETHFAGLIATRERLGRIRTSGATVELRPHRVEDIGPLPDGAVRADGPVFISYRQSDGFDRADHLEGLLRAAGLIVWRDQSDLRAGKTKDRLEQALTSGLSGGVLIVTPEIADSVIVQERELPRLLQLDDDPAFSLSIANEIPNPTDPTRLDYSAPDRLLGLAPARTLSEKKQSDGRSLTGQRQIVRDLLMHRIEERKAAIHANDGIVTLAIQTRPAPFASEADHSDLHIRIAPAPEGRTPWRRGLEHLQATLPLTSDAIRASGASTVRVSGGAHISAALALGAALPATKIAHLEVLDIGGHAWTSDITEDTDDPGMHTTSTTSTYTSHAETRSIAVFVTLTAGADWTAFDQLVRASSPLFSSVSRVEAKTSSPLDPRESARLSHEIAREIKRLSAEYGRADVHLAYHGPYTMAVLIGRLLNTVRTIVYEWDNPEGVGPRYAPALVLEPGTTQGPITRVLI
ncbi:SAVED domain-containing protein [Pengzhenrongella sicca]|uniref:SAVED domain-containing protein n=1 Tax=Pengzhenrongella sicca TaxID=2819238 RepID=A0A8A4ZAU7_9MICO|nr:SAVED domain-containing protein [Pengzhenrongella sicca]QTE28545.1 SAVED domain-containing protein [Pengzhenrongella sicca]